MIAIITRMWIIPLHSAPPFVAGSLPGQYFEPWRLQAGFARLRLCVPTKVLVRVWTPEHGAKWRKTTTQNQRKKHLWKWVHQRDIKWNSHKGQQKVPTSPLAPKDQAGCCSPRSRVANVFPCVPSCCQVAPELVRSRTAKARSSIG